MKLGRCPVCRTGLHLDALVQDTAGKTLLGTVAALSTEQAAALVGYLALFRPAKSDLANSRALRLISEVQALTVNRQALTQALEQTTQQISARRNESGDAKPLSNHNYLKKVLHSLPGWDQNLSTALQLPTGANHEKPARSATHRQDIGHALLQVDNSDWAK
ncbi:hypothetical protein [Bowmanella denitrificans]|uniref:hypothetical protein n=1 Tax=Bowmanella denitrificans TaxID=366582 RepID=UPI000C9BADD1|nr:hypothetical protein [Bowmanella denitrificans]